MELSKVSNLNMLRDLTFEDNDEGKRGCGDGAVINMNDNDYGSMTVVTTMMVEHSLVHVTSDKLQTLYQDLHEFLVPMMTQLLQAVQCLQKMAHLPRGIGGWIARGLFYEDVLILGKFSIQVGALDIDLMKLEIQLGSHCKYSLN